MRQNTVDIPYPANEKFTQDQSKEKRDGVAISGDAAVLQKQSLDKPTDENRKPHPIHRPTAG